MRLPIFLSWSGEQSKAVALALKRWLPQVVQAFSPWASPKDLGVGTPWFEEITARLEQSKAGVLCVTPQSLKSQWFMFEAGALSKHLQKDRACPYLIGLTKAQVDGPLLNLQLANSDKDGTFQLVETLNKLLALEAEDAALDAARLRTSFDQWWPQLEIDLATARRMAADTGPPAAQPEKMLEEILLRVREMSQRQSEVTFRALLAAVGKYPGPGGSGRNLAEIAGLSSSNLSPEQQADALTIAPASVRSPLRVGEPSVELEKGKS